MRRILPILLLAAALVGAPANAAKICYFVDMVHGTDYMLAALNASGNEVVPATSWSDFGYKLLSSGCQLAISLVQNYPAVTSGLQVPVVQNYINHGGAFIFATWTAIDAPVVNL